MKLQESQRILQLKKAPIKISFSFVFSFLNNLVQGCTKLIIELLSTIVNRTFKFYDIISKRGEEMNYYQRLRDLREDRDLKQIDIANVLKIEQTQYSRYERGVQMMGIDKYITLAKFYNVSLDFLTGLINSPEPLDRLMKK